MTENGDFAKPSLSRTFQLFWDEKKEGLTFAGFLLATGAIFLNINIPENTAAKIALSNLQFLWILIISLTSVWLGFSFLKFTWKVEEHYRKKTGLDITSGISTVVLASIAWFLYNTWKYTISLYGDEWHKFARLVSPGFSTLLFLIYWGILEKLYRKFEGITWKYVASSSVLILIMSAVAASMLAIGIGPFTLRSFSHAYLSGCLIYGALFPAVTALLYLFERRKAKK